MSTHSVFLPGESHGQRSLVGYSSWGHKDLNTIEQHFTLQWFVEHIMLGLPSVSPSCFASPSSLLPYSTQPCNPIYAASPFPSSGMVLPTLTKTIWSPVSLPDGTGVAKGHCRHSSPLKSQSHSPVPGCAQRAPRTSHKMQRGLPGAPVYCSHDVWGIGAGVQNNLYHFV